MSGFRTSNLRGGRVRYAQRAYNPPVAGSTPAPRTTFDLHGETAETIATAVDQALNRAFMDGETEIVLVTGSGLVLPHAVGADLEGHPLVESWDSRRGRYYVQLVPGPTTDVLYEVAR